MEGIFHVPEELIEGIGLGRSTCKVNVQTESGVQSIGCADNPTLANCRTIGDVNIEVPNLGISVQGCPLRTGDPLTSTTMFRGTVSVE